MLITSADWTAYDKGYQDGNAGLPPPGFSAPWWEREGWNTAVARFPQQQLELGKPPPLYLAVTPLAQSDVTQYNVGLSGQVGDNANYWYRVGAFDRANGRTRSVNDYSRFRFDVPGGPAALPQTPIGPPIVQLPPANQPPVNSGVPAIASTAMQAVDVTDYLQGYQSRAVSGRFWQREGGADALRGLPQQSLTPGYPPPAGPASAPIHDTELRDYTAGYNLDPRTAQAGQPYWTRQAMQDRAQAQPPQVLFLGQVVHFVGGATGDSVGPTFEVVATLFGKRQPYDLAVALGKVQGLQGLIPMLLNFGSGFELIGDGPDDKRRGYGLTGPNGAIARKVRGLIARGQVNPDPQTYGLPAWVGTETRSGVRLLGRGELQAIGLYDTLLDRTSSAFF